MATEGEVSLDDLIKKEKEEYRLKKTKQIEKDREERREREEKRKEFRKPAYNNQQPASNSHQPASNNQQSPAQGRPGGNERPPKPHQQKKNFVQNRLTPFDNTPKYALAVTGFVSDISINDICVVERLFRTWCRTGRS